MKKAILFLTALFVLSACNQLPTTKKYEYALVIHGGAGNMSIESVNEKNRILYTEKLNQALDTGLYILKEGGSSLDAVETVIRLLEDSPLFNAGRGAVFTHEGKNELDASIMEGKNLSAGAVAGVSDIKNPISAARKVMEKSPHVMLAGAGASEFAALQGLEIVDSSWFFTWERYDSYLQVLKSEAEEISDSSMKKMGTVGCVALDREGNLAAGTSTGGMTNKRWGRIGDSPVIGAGTYANNKTCGVSATGHGEYFIRLNVAHDISALMEYRGMKVNEAAREVIMNKLTNAGGTGGVICLDASGNHSFMFNTAGMFRAYANSEGERITAIFGKEDESQR